MGKQGYKDRAGVSRELRHRPFGGLNLLMFGDWWQLPPVMQTSLCANPFPKHVHGVQRMLDLFWGSDCNSVQQLHELTVNKRSGEDEWFASVIDECRDGALSWWRLQKIRLRSNIWTPTSIFR